ncbi:MAG: hypothetical protein J6Y08_03815 [Clostridiales bacterium]|nr:hypothetical protein [Clostridiales bacterium]
MKRCAKCNARNVDTAVVCKSCGASLSNCPIVEDNEDIPVESAKKNNGPIVAIILSLILIVTGVARGALQLDPEEEGFRLFFFNIVFVHIAVSAVILAICIYCLRRLFVIRPVPMRNAFALMLTVFCCILFFLDILSLPGLIKEYKTYKDAGVYVSYIEAAEAEVGK